MSAIIVLSIRLQQVYSKLWQNNSVLMESEYTCLIAIWLFLDKYLSYCMFFLDNISFFKKAELKI